MLKDDLPQRNEQGLGLQCRSEPLNCPAAKRTSGSWREHHDDYSNPLTALPKHSLGVKVLKTDKAFVVEC